MDDLLIGVYEERRPPPLDPSLLGKALWLGSLEGHLGGRERQGLKWRYPAGMVRFVLPPTFGLRERQHPHTWGSWFRPLWMQVMGAATRKPPSGHFYAPPQCVLAGLVGWTAAPRTSAGPPATAAGPAGGLAMGARLCGGPGALGLGATVGTVLRPRHVRRASPRL